MSDYYGDEVPAYTGIHGTFDYGDYDLPAPASAGVCRMCGEPLAKMESQVCHEHAVALYKARQQVKRLCELARQRRGRALIHEWWMATEGNKNVHPDL